MTVLADTINGGNFVLEHITSIDPVREDWDLQESDHWWSLGFKRVLTGYRFRVNLGADYVFIKGDTLEKAVELRTDLLKRLAGVTA